MANQPDVRIRLTAEGVADVIGALKKVQDGATSTAKAVASTAAGFDATSASVTALKSAVGKLAMAAAGLVAFKQFEKFMDKGFDKNNALEQANLSMAAVLATQARLVDSSGTTLKGQAAYAAAVKLSAGYMADLSKKAADANLNAGDMAAQSKAIVFTGLNVGVKDMGKLQDITIASAQTMQMLGKGVDNLGAQVANMLRGEGNDISKALGIDEASLKNWAHQGLIIDNVLKRVHANKDAVNAYKQSWEGVSAKLDSVSGKIAAIAAKDYFSKLKDGKAKAVASLFGSDGKLLPEINAIGEALNRVGNMWGELVADKTALAAEGVKAIGTWLLRNMPLVDSLATGFKTVANTIWDITNGVVAGIAAIAEKTSLLTRAVGGVVMVANTAAGLWNVIRRDSSKVVSAFSGDEDQKSFLKIYQAEAQAQSDLNYQRAMGGARTLITGEGPVAPKPAPATKTKPDASVMGGTNKRTASQMELATAKMIAAAKLALKVAEAEQEAKLDEANAKLKEAKEKAAYDAGLVTLVDYQAARVAAINAAAQRELALLKEKEDAAKAMPSSKTEDKLVRAKALAEAAGAIAVREAQLERDLFTEQQAQQQELTNQKREALKLTAEYEELMGKRGEVARVALEAEIADHAKLLKQQGVELDTVNKITDAMRKRGQAQIDFEAASTGADAVNGKYDLQKKGVEVDLAGGNLWGFEAAKKLADIEKARLADLEAAAQKMAEIANGPGGTDDMKTKSAELNLAVKQLRTSTNEYGLAMALVKQTLESSLSSGFNTMLDSLIDGTATAKEAFRAFASDVINNIRKVAQEFMVQQAMKMFFGSFTGGASAMFATGGLVRGPGTGKSDSINARLSNGEYVLNANAVSGIGVGALDMLNATGSLEPMLANSYAAQSIPTVDGAMVNSIQQAAGGGTSRIELGLEPGLVARHIKSTEGQKAVVEVLGARRRSVKKATS